MSMTWVRQSVLMGTATALLGFAVAAVAQEPAMQKGGPPPIDKPAVKQPAQPRPRVVLIREIVDPLRLEAKNAVNQRRPWPRAMADYVKKENVTAHQEDVIRALASLIDSDPTVDAYIKWQLLGGLKVDLKGLDDETYRKIITSVPKLYPLPVPDDQVNVVVASSSAGQGLTQVQTARPTQQPQGGKINLRPNSSDRASLGVATSGVGIGTASANMDVPIETQEMDPRVRETRAQQLNASTLRQRQGVTQANRPSLAYRDLLSAQLPSDRGVKLAAMVEDAKARFFAGEPTIEKAMALVEQEARTGGKLVQPDGTLWVMIVRGLRSMNDQPHYTLTGITYDKALNRIVNRVVMVVIPAAAMQSILNQLPGPPTTP